MQVIMRMCARSLDITPIACYSGSYMLGLCEGNHCLGGRKGRDSGNGRIAVFQLDGAGEDCRCAWTGTSLSLKRLLGSI